MTVPCLTNIWFTSRRMSQPSMIIRSIARFFRMFSVSLTCSDFMPFNNFRSLILCPSMTNYYCEKVFLLSEDKTPHLYFHLLRF